MGRARMRTTEATTRRMLSTRLPLYVYDRMLAYAVESRHTIEEIVQAALTDHLDKESPHTKSKFKPAPEPHRPGDAAIEALVEEKLQAALAKVLEHRAAPAGRKAR